MDLRFVSTHRFLLSLDRESECLIGYFLAEGLTWPSVVTEATSIHHQRRFTLGRSAFDVVVHPHTHSQFCSLWLEQFSQGKYNPTNDPAMANRAAGLVLQPHVERRGRGPQH